MSPKTELAQVAVDLQYLPKTEQQAFSTTCSHVSTLEQHPCQPVRQLKWTDAAAVDKTKHT